MEVAAVKSFTSVVRRIGARRVTVYARDEDEAWDASKKKGGKKVIARKNIMRLMRRHVADKKEVVF